MEERLQAPAPDLRLGHVAVDDGADAGDPGVERDGPEPSVRVGLDEDVGLVGRRQAGRPLEVGEDGHVAEEGVPAPQVEGAAEERRLAAGVDHEVGDQAAGATIAFIGDAHRPAVLEQHLRDAVTLAHVHAVTPAVLEQDLVEVRAPHLVGVGIARVGLAEVPAPRLPLPAPDHGGAVLLEETGAMHVFAHAERLEHGHAGR